MAQGSFPFPKTGELRDVLSEIPERVRTFLRKGFAAICGLDPTTWPTLIKTVQVLSNTPSDLELEQAAKQVGLPLETVSGALSATRMVFGGVVVRGEPSARVIDAFMEGNILSPEHGEAITRFADLVATDKTNINETIDRNWVQQDLMPSLREFDLRVDLGFRWEGLKVMQAAPVVLVHLAIDANDGEFWFQMTPHQVAVLQKALAEVGDRVASVESIAKGVVNK